MKTLRQFREENGLGDMKATSDVTGPESEMLNDIARMFREGGDMFRRVLRQCLDAGSLSQEEENEVKKLIGIIGHLQNSSPESKKKMRDPLDNVVVRPHNGPDGSGGDSGGGGGGE
jgi:hypothetical protein